MGSKKIVFFEGTYANDKALALSLSRSYEIHVAKKDYDFEKLSQIRPELILIDLSIEDFDVLGACIDIVGDSELNCKLVCCGDHELSDLDYQNIETLATKIFDHAQSVDAILDELNMLLK